MSTKLDSIVKKVLGLAGVKSTVLRRRYPLKDIAPGTAIKTSTHGPKLVQVVNIGAATGGINIPANIDGNAVERASSEMDGQKKLHAVVCDTRNITSLDDLTLLHTHLQKSASQLGKNGRLIMVSGSKSGREAVVSSTVAAAVGGFTKSLSKEYGGAGITANMIRVADGAHSSGEDGCLSFLLSDRSSFITGQFFDVTNREPATASNSNFADINRKRIVVTGASRGIGESTVKLLHADGAQVLLVDHPSMADRLGALASKLNFKHLTLDVTDPEAPSKLKDGVGAAFGDAKLDVVVHNAGITKDKSFKKMSDADFRSVIQVNLASIHRMDQALLSGSVLNAGSRLVYLSSVNGIAGAFGQTNYSCTKAGIIGYARAMARAYGDKGIAFNAVAPGFIETEMTGKIPFLTRNVARHLNSLLQEGYPLDVAEIIAFLASHSSSGLNGETIRVCGGNLVGH
jgi:3-oxoacyl-[acyl-carrier protein] reductase